MSRKFKRRNLTPISLAIAISRHRPRRTLEPYISASRVDQRRSEDVEKTSSTPICQVTAMSRHRPRQTLMHYIRAFGVDDQRG
jgi:hypothetical protein